MKCIKVSVIIVNYNSEKLLKKCIKSIFKFEKDDDFEIIVIDNNSNDNSIKYIEKYPIKIIRLEENVGFARANNIGVKYCSSDYVLFLNPDTELIDNAITSLYNRFTEIDDCKILGPQLLNRNGSLQQSYFLKFTGIYNFLGQITSLNKFYRKNDFLKKLFQKKTRHIQYFNLIRVHLISGACLFTTKSWFDGINCFDENYFLFYEDIDFCKKTINNKGKIYIDPNIKIKHYIGGSKVEKEYVYYQKMKSMFVYLKKYKDNSYIFTIKLIFILNILFRYIFYLLKYKNMINIKKYFQLLKN